jgi:hypothetical protein
VEVGVADGVASGEASPVLASSTSSKFVFQPLDVMTVIVVQGCVHPVITLVMANGGKVCLSSGEPAHRSVNSAADGPPL